MLLILKNNNTYSNMHLYDIYYTNMYTQTPWQLKQLIQTSKVKSLHCNLALADNSTHAQFSYHIHTHLNHEKKTFTHSNSRFYKLSKSNCYFFFYKFFKSIRHYLLLYCQIMYQLVVNPNFNS